MLVDTDNGNRGEQYRQRYATPFEWRIDRVPILGFIQSIARVAALDSAQTSGRIIVVPIWRNN